jgi:hypothetical protein
MEYPDGAAEDSRLLIAPLRQLVQGWIDGDRVLPADGARLLALLEGLAGAKGAPAQAGNKAFIDGVQALIEAGLLDAAEGRLALEGATQNSKVKTQKEG